MSSFKLPKQISSKKGGGGSGNPSYPKPSGSLKEIAQNKADTQPMPTMKKPAAVSS